MKLLSTIAAVMLASSAIAADMEVTKVQTGPVSFEYEMTISKGIIASDGKLFDMKLQDVPEGSKLTLILDSPGGSGAAMRHITESMKKYDVSTIIHDNVNCVSACAVIWMGSADRTLVGSGAAKFHVGSIGDSKVLARVKDDEGWFGLQEFVQYTFASSMKLYMDMPNVAQPWKFIESIVNEGFSRRELFTVDKDNLEIVGGKHIEG